MEGRRKEGKKEGRKEGRKKGRKKGRKEGREEGRKEGKKERRRVRKEGRTEGRKERRKEGSTTATWKCLLPSCCISWYTTPLRRSGPSSSNLGLPPAETRNGCPQASRTQASTSSRVSAFTSFKPPLWRRSASTRAKVSKYTLVAWSDSRRSGPRLTNHGGCFWTSLRRPQATALATNIVGTTGLNRMA